jgi:adenylyltransferase/sulfurtransferase
VPRDPAPRPGRFRFASAPFDVAAEQAALADPACGGYAAFEGWVRNHNEGHDVQRLEYEAYELLAVKEGERIVAEACERFGVEKAVCVHRIGNLAIGELAVWVGVSARHRDEAFRACRYIIDEVKHRVPIWKKEHYRNGDSGWVNCERCATAPLVSGAAAHGHEGDRGHGHGHGHQHPHNHDHDHGHGHAPHGEHVRHEHARQPVHVPDYSRQMALPEVGVRGQARLRASHVAVVGAGGLGVPVLQYLAGAGIGRLTIVDGDRLEPSNLHRQTLYALADCGRAKAELAGARVRALNPDVEVRARVERLDASNAATLLRDADLVLDCSDNFSTKFLINDVAASLGIPALFASVYQYEGQLQLVRPGAAGACMRCVWPQATRDGVVGNCAEAGVLGPVPGVFGSLQALEALKFLMDLPGQLRDEVLVVDLTTFSTSRVRARRAADCGTTPCARVEAGLAESRRRLDATRDALEGRRPIELQFDSIEAAAAAGYAIVDVRNEREAADDPASGSVSVEHLPLARIASGESPVARGELLVVCARGQRSLEAALELRARGRAGVHSLRGGLAALRGRQARV